MKCLILVHILTLLACSAPPLVSKTEYAFTYFGGHGVLCSKAFQTSCGVSLSECNTSSHYDCVTDVEIVDLKEIDRRVKLERQRREGEEY